MYINTNKIKAYTIIFLVLVLLVNIIVPSTLLAADEGTIIFTVDQKGYQEGENFNTTDIAPYIKAGRTMVPVAVVSPALGSEKAKWYPTEKKVEIKKDNSTIYLWIGRNYMEVDGERINIDVPAEIKEISSGGGRTMLPIAWIARAIGADYRWDSTKKAVCFYKTTTYTNTDTYGPENGNETIKGSVVIKAGGTILQNTTITGNLIIAESVGDGDVYLNNVTVKGETYVRGGGKNSIHINGGNYTGNFIIENTPEGGTRIAVTDAQGVTVVVATGEAGEEVVLEGEFESIEVRAENAKLSTQGNTTIGTMTVNNTAEINLATGTKVNTFTANTELEVKGNGTIVKANVNVGGVSFDVKPTYMNVDSGVTQQPTIVYTPSDDTGSNSGSGNSNTNTPPADTTAPIATLTAPYSGAKTALQITFSEALHADTLAIDNLAALLQSAVNDVTGTPAVIDVSNTTAGTVTWDNSSLSAPIANLTIPTTTFTAGQILRLKFKASAVKDTTGNAITDATNIDGVVAAAPPDTTAPTPGNSGTLTFNNVTETTLTLNWTKAVDDISDESNLQYLVYYSTSNNIDTVANIKANGTAVGSYTQDIDSKEITGLNSDTTYFFNVLVKDEAGNESAYAMMNIKIVPQLLKLIDSDGAANDKFGRSVAIFGDRIVVGAYQDDDKGSVCIYEKDSGGENNWGFVKKLLASDGASNDYFGYSVAISGNRIVVGAYFDDNGNNSGSVYIYEKDSGGENNWGEVKKLTASDGALYDYFGYSVAISSDKIAVGAYHDDDNGNNSGSVYIYEKDSGGDNNWGEVKKLTASDGEVSDFFGYSVAISGDRIVVGAPYGDDIVNGCDSGSVYIYEKDSGGENNWGEVKKLIASDGASNDKFGYSVAISGDKVVVGVPYDDDNGDSSGSVYTYEKDFGGENNWGKVKKLIASDGASNDYFGYCVSISGDKVAVGAYGDDDNGNSSGSVYIYEKDSGGENNWGQVKKLTASDGASNDNFGHSVAISGDTVVAGNNGKEFVNVLSGWMAISDTTAPTAQVPTIGNITETTAEITVNASETGTVYWSVLGSPEAEPAKADIVAQIVGVLKGNASYDTADQKLNVTGLTTGTTYKAYVVFEDAVGNRSDVKTSLEFTTN